LKKPVAPGAAALCHGLAATSGICVGVVVKGVTL
jgi:hypothetical protein